MKSASCNYPLATYIAYMFTKTCTHCSAPFTSPASKQMFCSVSCTLRHRLAPLAVVGSCWEWPGARRPYSNYGMIRRDRVTFWAHRVAHETFNGPIPPDHIVCHRCDNPPCCNPAHLFAGTVKDNFDDMMSKGRWSPPTPITGEQHHEARLTPSKVIEIRRQNAGGRSMRSLGRHHGISHEAIRKVIRRETWAHVE